PALDAGNARRRDIAARYGDGLAGTGVRLLEPRGDSEPVYHLYPLRLARRDVLRDYLEARGVGTGIHYPIPAHRQPALTGIPHRAGPMKVTDESCGALLSIPMYPTLRDEQVDYVIEAIREFLRNG
ncbi:MAG: DegT/DnrJ/EryC1/StrS family aminotransferase, partial [Deltaproteobacteria bacterium]|nr:DegT/DnrJ/EryC1/StrS family aminotransferase [Deltaproteobacteria bacterium]